MDDYRGQEHNPRHGHGQWYTGNSHHGQPNAPVPPHQHPFAHTEEPQTQGQNANMNAGRGYEPNGMGGSSASTTVADAQRLLSVYPFASATPTSHGAF